MTDSQQHFYLNAMGIQVWERRELSPADAEEGERVKDNGDVSKEVTLAPLTLNREPSTATRPQTVSAPDQQNTDDGIPSWLDDAPPPEPPPYDMEGGGDVDEAFFLPEVASTLPDDLSSLDWPALQQRVVDCVACPELVACRTQTVFGCGNQQADWMIISGAPTVDEDKQGQPFVEKTGQLFSAMLHALGLRREQVYITNIIKCCTPENREPTGQEAIACEPFIRRQIALVQPRVILAVGRIAAQNLLRVDTPIGELRGSVHQYAGTIPLVVTYHPDYLLRSPLEKRKSWDDLCLARSAMSGESE